MALRHAAVVGEGLQQRRPRRVAQPAHRRELRVPAVPRQQPAEDHRLAELQHELRLGRAVAAAAAVARLREAPLDGSGETVASPSALLQRVMALNAATLCASGKANGWDGVCYDGRPLAEVRRA